MKCIQCKFHQAIQVGGTVTNSASADKLGVSMDWSEAGLLIQSPSLDFDILIPAYNCFEVRLEKAPNLVKQEKSKKA